ncbi:hypothetical protein [Caldivirga sp. MU80]|uniref:hypothetical protein n=1 Tax=Caldivirga sp. MU80 TaxID=1650354 RepID=UPI0008371888|nr:hypothetical protein [Caldivirga sp. MU80]
MEEETLSFAQESTVGPISLSVDLYVDLGAISGNQYTASAAVERALDVLTEARNGLVLRGKVIGGGYIVYINAYDKTTIHIRINVMDGVCMECVARRMLEAVAKAINARLEDVIVATY